MFSSTHKRYKDNIYKINPESAFCNETCDICGDCVNQVLSEPNFFHGSNYYDENFLSVWINKLKHYFRHKIK